MYFVWCVTPPKHKQILSIVHQNVFVWSASISACTLTVCILPFRRGAPIWLQSAAHWEQIAQIYICRWKTVSSHLLRQYKEFSHDTGPKRTCALIPRLWMVQFYDLVWICNGDFRHNPQNTVYSTTYQVPLCIGSKAVTAQLSLSLIKYWTRA